MIMWLRNFPDKGLMEEKEERTKSSGQIRKGKGPDRRLLTEDQAPTANI
jgi:hypothetical protein